MTIQDNTIFTSHVMLVGTHMSFPPPPFFFFWCLLLFCILKIFCLAFRKILELILLLVLVVIFLRCVVSIFTALILWKSILFAILLLASSHSAEKNKRVSCSVVGRNYVGTKKVRRIRFVFLELDTKIYLPILH